MPFRIAPSILAADFLHLEKDVELVNSCGDVIHLDVMDGTLVPNISFGFSVIDQLSKVAKAPMDVHLMVVHPERWFKKVADDGVQMCSFHLEAAGRKTSSFIKEIQSLGMKAGVAINPDVPVERLFPYIGKADYFLIMSVFAGFGGQKFIYESIDRVAALEEERLGRHHRDRRGDQSQHRQGNQGRGRGPGRGGKFSIRLCRPGLRHQGAQGSLNIDLLNSLSS